MDKIVAERIINSLECGIVPMDDVGFFTTGRASEIEEIKILLNDTKSGKSKLLFVHGDYGIGKTHFLALTKNEALENKFLVSHVTLTSRECPLSQMEYVYANILKNISFKGQQSPSGFLSFLDLWLGLVNEKFKKDINKKCKHYLTYRTCSFGCVEELYCQQIPELAKVNTDFKDAIKLYHHAIEGGNELLKDELIRWFLGEKVNLKWINIQAKNLKIYERIISDNSFIMLKSIASISKISGFSGLVILFDEAERIPSIVNVTIGYFNLIRIIYESLNLHGVCFIYATTPQFYDDAKRHFRNFETEETKEILKEVYQRMEDERLILSLLPKESLITIANKIFSIYLISKGQEDSTEIHKKWKNNMVANSRHYLECGTMREVIGKVMKDIKELGQT